MRPRKPHAKSEIGRRPDSRIEVGVLGHTDIVNNLATGKKTPREALFGAIYRNITPPAAVSGQADEASAPRGGGIPPGSAPLHNYCGSSSRSVTAVAHNGSFLTTWEIFFKLRWELNDDILDVF